MSEINDEELLQFARQIAAAERELCAKLLEMSNSQLLLMCGEMSAQELRTVKAVLAQRAAMIRKRLDS